VNDGRCCDQEALHECGGPSAFHAGGSGGTSADTFIGGN